MGQTPLTPTGNSTSTGKEKPRFCIAQCTDRKRGSGNGVTTGPELPKGKTKEMVKDFLNECKDGKDLFDCMHKDTELPILDRIKEFQRKKEFEMSPEEWERRVVIIDNSNHPYRYPFHSLFAVITDTARYPFKVKLDHSGIRDISDLVTMHDPSLDDFITWSPEGEKLKTFGLVTEEGNVTTRSLGPPTYQGMFPSNVESVTCGGENAKYRIHMRMTEEPDVKMTSRIDGKDLSKQVLKALAAGYEDFSMFVCRELVVASFNKMNVVEGRELDTNSEVEDWNKSWVITSFVWVVEGNFQFCLKEDLLWRACSDVVYGMKTKEKALAEMRIRNEGADTGEEKRFMDILGDAMYINYERYLKKKREAADSRLFDLYQTDGIQKSALCNACSIDNCCAALLQHLCAKSMNWNNWKMCLGWEPVKLIGVEEHIQWIKHMQNHNRIQEAMETGIKAVDLVVRKHKSILGVATPGQGSFGETPRNSGKHVSVRTSRTPRDMGTPLRDADGQLLLQVGKDMVDRVCKLFEEKVLTMDRFEDQVTRICTRMIDFVHYALLPMAEKHKSEDYQIYCLRARADFMRLMIAYVPRHKEKEEECMHMYNQAIAKRFNVDGWCQAILNCYVNAALFAAECLRNREEAVLICAAGRRHFQSKPVRPSCPHELPTSGAVFAASLLESNKQAFATWLVVVVVEFDEASLAAHAKLVTHPEPSPKEEPVAEFLDESAELLDFVKCGIGGLFQPEPAKKVEVAPEVVQEKKTEMQIQIERAAADREYVVGEWLHARPLHSIHFRDMDMVRWVSKGEPYDERVLQQIADDDAIARNKDHSDGVPVIRRRTSQRKMSVQEQLVPTSQNKFVFMVTLRPREDCDGREREAGLKGKAKEGEVGWSDNVTEEFKSSLESWPDFDNDRTHITSFETPMPIDLKLNGRGNDQELAKLNRALNKHGVIKRIPGSDAEACNKCNATFRDNMTWCVECKSPRAPRFWRINGYKLYPGDQLIQVGDGGYSLEKIRKLQMPQAPLLFLPSLKVKDCRIFTRGSYADNHECFSGWGDGGKNLTFEPVPKDSTFVDMARNIRDQRTEMKSPRAPARRIRNLSARRDALLAASRGCN